jgi:geranylgeranyl diphosphate synthase type II
MSHRLITPAEAGKLVEKGLNSLPFPVQPAGLYDPARYFLALGGKRIRPSLTLLAANIFHDSPERFLSPALAMEVFHNFTLVHDDIMDNAPLRRGAATVHEKWNLNTAILSGDLLMIEAYRLLSEAPADSLKAVFDVFNKTAVEVCEGQQLDMDFEQQAEVALGEYIEMIRLKTSVLLGCSLGVGAICAGAPAPAIQALYAFGEQLGIAFQIMDDLLDTFPGPENFGKKAGGDIERNKKTFLYLKALEQASDKDADHLKQLFNSQAHDKVANTIDLFRKYDVAAHAEDTMRQYFDHAMLALQQIKQSGYPTDILEALGQAVYNRKF